jgi:formamidopyrimidine-DNA glycosylase
MPELPEVETVRRKMEKALKGKRIVEVHGDPGDRFLFREAGLPAVKETLLGATVRGSGRKGKYFWLQLNRHPWPLFHLGMTGNVEIRSPRAKGHAKSWGGLRLWSNKGGHGGEGRLWFCRLLLTAEDGTEVALTDPRRFGRLWLCEEPLLHPRVRKLGFDPLLHFPPASELAPLLRKRKAPIKSLLLDQGLFAGVGNWIADEILFQARLSPRRLASSLEPPEVKRLREKTVHIIRRAVEVDADYDRFPRTWLFHHRWGRDADAYAYGRQKIIHEEIGGRTTAWVPSRQK